MNPNNFIDTHCHLSFEDLGAYSEKTLTILKQAKNNLIDLIINIATDEKGFEKALDFSNLNFDEAIYPKIFTALGIHPLHLKENESFKIESLLKYINNKKLIAIGETGLDYYYSKDNITLQKKLFEEHCFFASKNKLPIIVHSRAAAEDTIDILKTYVKEYGLKGVIHCFSYDKEIAKKFLNIGFYLSFSGIITFKNATELASVIDYMPFNYILSETDAPYLAPSPYRGKTNYPEYVKYVSEKIAQIKNESLIKTNNIIASNVLTLFNKINI